MRTDRGPLLPHFTDSPSWLLDPGSWTWSALPESAGETNNLSGVLDRDRASYDIPNSAGGVASATPLVVYDSGTQVAVTIPAPPGREGAYGESSTAQDATFRSSVGSGGPTTASASWSATRCCVDGSAP
jgi:hypothetical protein